MPLKETKQEQVQTSYALTASSLSRLRYALSDGAIRTSATLPSSGLVGAAIAPANNSSKGYQHPSIASIFGSMLPSFPSSGAAAATSSTKPAARHSMRPSSVQEAEVIARPAPAVVVQSTQPEPRLLRKTASQHTLRKVARPILDTAEVTVLPDCLSTSPEETPRKRPEVGMPGIPRHVAHRNPRDSPVGETRVVKSSPVAAIATGSPAALSRRPSMQQQGYEGIDSPVRRGRSSKGPSILDSAGEEGGLWTAPPGSPASSQEGKPSALTPRSSTSILSNSLPSSSSSTSRSAPPRRPQLRAKESLEHILAIRKRQEAADLERSLRKLEKEKAAAVQARQQSPAGRRALGQLSSFHREALSRGSGSGSEGGTPPASPTLQEHGEENQCPVFKMPIAPIEERPSPPKPKRSTSMPTASSPSATTTTTPTPTGKSKSEQQGKLVRGPAVVGGPKRPLSLVGSAPQQQTQVAQVGKAPPVPERTFTGTLKGLFGTAMDWIAEDLSECPPSPPLPPPGASTATRRVPPPASSSRHSREAASTLRGPPPSMRKEGGYSAYSTLQGTKNTIRPRPALNPAAAYAPSRNAAKRADNEGRPRSADMARRSHSLPVPTIVIHEPTCE